MRSTLYTHALARLALPVALRANAVVNGPAIDAGVFGNDFRTLMFVVATGTITDGSHAFTVQDSLDGSSWANADSALIQGSLPTVTGPDDDKVFEFGYVVSGARQFVRLVATTTGATTGGTFGAVVLLGGASVSPVARA